MCTTVQPRPFVKADVDHVQGQAVFSSKQCARRLRARPVDLLSCYSCHELAVAEAVGPKLQNYEIIGTARAKSIQCNCGE